MNDKLIKIINAAFFYLIWWGCILGIRSDLYYLGPMLTAVFILVHLNMISEVKKEMMLMACCGALALVVESVVNRKQVVILMGELYRKSFCTVCGNSRPPSAPLTSAFSGIESSPQPASC